MHKKFRAFSKNPGIPADNKSLISKIKRLDKKTKAGINTRTINDSFEDDKHSVDKKLSSSFERSKDSRKNSKYEKIDKNLKLSYNTNKWYPKHQDDAIFENTENPLLKKEPVFGQDYINFIIIKIDCYGNFLYGEDDEPSPYTQDKPLEYALCELYDSQETKRFRALAQDKFFYVNC